MNTERIENSISEPTAIRGEDGFLICPLTQRKNENAKKHFERTRKWFEENESPKERKKRRKRNMKSFRKEYRKEHPPMPLGDKLWVAFGYLIVLLPVFAVGKFTYNIYTTTPDYSVENSIGT